MIFFLSFLRFYISFDSYDYCYYYYYIFCFDLFWLTFSSVKIYIWFFLLCVCVHGWMVVCVLLIEESVSYILYAIYWIIHKHINTHRTNKEREEKNYRRLKERKKFVYWVLKNLVNCWLHARQHRVVQLYGGICILLNKNTKLMCVLCIFISSTSIQFWFLQRGRKRIIVIFLYLVFIWFISFSYEEEEDLFLVLF